MFGMWDGILTFLMRHVGARTDAANPAGSLHAKAGAIKNVVDRINTSVGSSGDAPNRNGSLHAKISNLDISRKIPKINVVNTTAMSFSPFNISGSGYLIGLGIFADYNLPRLIVTIDGNTLVSSEYVSSTAFVIPLLHRFNQNARITLNFDGSTNVTALLTYILD